MESNAAVTLNFEDFACKNYLFLKDPESWLKINNKTNQTLHNIFPFYMENIFVKFNHLQQRQLIK